MPDAVGSLMRHGALALCLCVAAVPLAAQTPAPPVEPLAVAPTTVQFISRFDFHLSGAGLVVDDSRFSWDTHFGGDFDLLDYVFGRLSFLADYQAVLGNEFGPFDPYEGNYTLEVDLSFRAHGNEFMTALHHVSRHLGDRPKLVRVAWNEVDVRWLRQYAIDGTTMDVHAEGGKVIQHAYTDYRWTANLSLAVRHPINPNVGVFGLASGRVVGVVPASTRGLQQGGRVEAGLRLSGRNGALELFAGVERVIDADLFDELPRRWAFAGFRIVTK